MNNIDPDIIAALKTIAADADLPRVVQARKRHDAHTQRRFETQMELMADEVEKVCPRDQGRSKKALRMKLVHDGRVFVARFEGRPDVCFGSTVKEATYNLRAGQ